jgi:hypothetical protein
MIHLPDLKLRLRNHPRLLKNYNRVRRRWYRWAPQPDLRNWTTLADLPTLVMRVKFQRPSDSVDGWLSLYEAAALYILGRTSTGPVLEVGAWLGRSTICLARGMIDAGTTAEFMTCELAPTPANFRETTPGMIGFFYPADSGESMGDCPVAEYENGIKPIMTRPGGILGQLEGNLEQAGVRPRVTIRVGDFRTLPTRQFATIFCDAMHNIGEIDRNASDLKRLLAPGGILACHDTSPENAEALGRHFRFVERTQVDSLFVGRIA